MEQLRAISFCSSPRSYRNRNTSLILRMDKPFWGIGSSSAPEEKSPTGYPAPPYALTQKARSQVVNIEPGPTAPVLSRLGLFTSPESLSTCPESLSTSLRNPYPHRPGIPIHMPRNTHSTPTQRWTTGRRVAVGETEHHAGAKRIA